MLKKEWLEIRAIEKEQLLIERAEEDIIEKIKKSEVRDEEVIKARVKVLKNNEWQIEDDLVLKEGKVYVLKDNNLRMEIIWLYHNTLIAGYRGQWKTIELVTRNYWWPEVTKEVK